MKGTLSYCLIILLFTSCSSGRKEELNTNANKSGNIQNPRTNEIVNDKAISLEDSVINKKAKKQTKSLSRIIEINRNEIDLKGRLFPVSEFSNSNGFGEELIIFNNKFDSLFLIATSSQSITSIPLEFSGPNSVVSTINRIAKINHELVFLASRDTWFIMDRSGKVLKEVNPRDILNVTPELNNFNFDFSASPHFILPNENCILVFATPRFPLTFEDLGLHDKNDVPMIWEISLKDWTCRPLSIYFPEELLKKSGSDLINSLPYLFVNENYILLSNRLNFTSSLYSRTGQFLYQSLQEKNKEIPAAVASEGDAPQDVAQLLALMNAPFGGSPAVFHAASNLFFRAYWFRKENRPLEKRLIAWDSKGVIHFDQALPEEIKPQPLFGENGNLIFLPIQPDTEDYFVFYEVVLPEIF